MGPNQSIFAWKERMFTLGRKQSLNKFKTKNSNQMSPFGQLLTLVTCKKHNYHSDGSHNEVTQDTFTVRSAEPSLSRASANHPKGYCNL